VASLEAELEHVQQAQKEKDEEEENIDDDDDDDDDEAGQSPSAQESVDGKEAQGAQSPREALEKALQAQETIADLRRQLDHAHMNLKARDQAVATAVAAFDMAKAARVRHFAVPSCIACCPCSYTACAGRTQRKRGCAS
jgi:hypothetical protein